MYRTCLFCAADLGHNVEIEQFPVGRRLAFDPAHGRLWVVCRKCERWNLTPLEERWEAIEQCERRFRDTRLRVSTDNIGLARLTSGLELVRIGSALRPEMAAWRYGDQFGRRRRRHFLYVGGAVAVGAGIVIAGPLFGLVSVGGISPAMNLFNLSRTLYSVRKKVRLTREGAAPLEVRFRDIRETRIVSEDEGWALQVSADSGLRLGALGPLGPSSKLIVQLTGRDAMRAAGALLPYVNRAGASQDRVRDAVGLLERADSMEHVFRNAATVAQTGVQRRRRRGFDFAFARQFRPADGLAALPGEVRLALEMASHEEAERAAMKGELALLEAAWRDAEEIAAIADDLLTPQSDRQFIERNRSPGPSDPE